MDQNQKKSALAKYFAGKGIINPADVEAEIAKLAGTFPAASAAELGITDDVDKAYEAMLVLTGSNNNNAGGKNMAGTGVSPVQGTTSAERVAIEKKLIAEQAEHDAVSRNTVIEKLIFDNPDPADVIPAGTKGVINAESFDKFIKKFTENGYKLVDDEESAKNFNELKEKAASGQEVEVYISKPNRRPIGYLVRKGTPTGTGSSAVQMTREDFTQFLTLETSGYILSTPTTAGSKLNIYAAKPKANKPGEIIPERYVAVDVNKAAAIESGSYDCSKEVLNETKKATLKSALSFKYTTGRKKVNGGGDIVSTGRASVVATVKATARKAVYVDTFGTGVAVSNKDLTVAPTGKSLEKIQAAQSAAIANLISKANSGNSKDMRSVQKNMGLIEQFMAPAGGVSSNVTL